MPTAAPLLIGLAAGLASALLFAGLVLQSATAVGLSLAAPVPIFLASLGWGSRSGFIAAIVAGLCVGLATSSPTSGMTLLVTTALPAALIGHLAGLARPASEVAPGDTAIGVTGGGLVWYPLERILLATAACAAAACIFLGWLIGFDPQALIPAVSEAVTQEGGGRLEAATAQEVAAVAAMIIRLMPFVQPAVLVFTLVTGLYVAAALVRASGRLPRPKDDIPLETSLPKSVLPALALATAGCFLPGLPGAVAAVITGALSAALMLVGLAALHRHTRGRNGRGLLLFTTYTAIFLLAFLPALAFTLVGILETARRPAAGQPRR